MSTQPARMRAPPGAVQGKISPVDRRSVLLGMLLGAWGSRAQNVSSAKPGLCYHVKGLAFRNKQRLAGVPAEMSYLEANDQLRGIDRDRDLGRPHASFLPQEARQRLMRGQGRKVLGGVERRHSGQEQGEQTEGAGKREGHHCENAVRVDSIH